MSAQYFEKYSYYDFLCPFSDLNIKEDEIHITESACQQIAIPIGAKSKGK